jgi:glycine/sarcosine N-methyltransferase
VRYHGQVDFYEQLSGCYDRMTRFEARLQAEEPILQLWLERHRIERALDAACGTGVHAILLALKGVRTAGADISMAMLDRAREHATRLGADVRWLQAPLQELSGHFSETFDAVFCLGNSIPHLLEDSDLERAVGSFTDLIRPGGLLLLQLLNYHRILQEQERIVAIQRSPDVEFIRFYDFLGERLRFNVLTIEGNAERPHHQLHGTILRPYRSDELVPALKAGGFDRTEIFGDMRRSPFEPERSANLVIAALK